MKHWPPFWNHVPEQDRPVLSDILTNLLGNGVLLGDSGKAKEMFLVAREYQSEIADYLAVIGIELFVDSEHPIFQARPIPGDCGLRADFSKDETLLILTLWSMYDEMRMDQPSEVFVITADDLFARLKVYFQNVGLPTESALRDALNKFRQRRLIRLSRDPDKFGDSRIEILPTLARAIPFDSPEEWAEHAQLFQGSEPESEPIPSTVSSQSDE